MNFAVGWHWFRVSRRTRADPISGMMVKGVIQISSIIGGQFVILVKFVFNAAHKDIGEQRTKRRPHEKINNC